MADLSNYNFKYLTVKIVKPEEYFINLYVYKCLEYESSIRSTRRMRKILHTKYEEADLNKVMTEKCQHLRPSKQDILLNI